ncbi:AbfB domain-containing protein [Actinoplanes sp. NPDC049596]|uniref:AbfB domain-containing protein n=1 Tax=unclassified Actinoplanes TaxID=2626549 RepID=UPI0034370A45
MKIMRPGARSVLAASVVAVLAAGFTPQPAIAAERANPLLAMRAVADDPLPEATLDEKYKAALLVGAGDDFTLQALLDCDFVHEIAVHAGAGPEMRKAAQEAFNAGTVSGGDTSNCTAFIREGIFAANLRDQANEQYERAERDARQAAAAVIGLAVTPALLAMDNYDFVAQVMSFAEPGTLVYEGADAAITSNDADKLRAYITAGIFEAHRQDVIDAIERDKEKTEAEKAAALWKATKARALAVLGVVATEEMLVLDDTNFVYLISTKAVDGSEIEAAATEALSSFDQAKRKTFIETGIYEANQRDIAKALQKQAEENRAAARQIQAKAENSLVHPALVAAAKAALAGSDADVSRFLRDGQYAAVTQTLRTVDVGRTGWYLRGSSAQVSLAYQGATAGAALTDATWKVVPGLGDAACHSLESTVSPGYYLREAAYFVKLAANDGSDAFKTSATWCASAGKAGSNVSLESKSKPGRFLRHWGTELWTSANTTSYDFDLGCGFDSNATWKFDNPSAPALTDPGTGDLCGDLTSVKYAGEVLADSHDSALRFFEYADLEKQLVDAWRYNIPPITGMTIPGEVAGGELDGVKGDKCVANPTCVVQKSVLMDDFAAIERSTGKLYLYPNLGKVGANPRKEIGASGWNGMRDLMIGKFCVSATAANGNLVAVERSTGKLWCYTLNTSTFTMTRKEIGTGWGGYDRLTAGDFGVGDANAHDILTVERSTGALWLYPAKVNGGFGTRIQVNANFSAYVNLVAGNFNGAGTDDLIAFDKAGHKYFWPGTGGGKFGTRVQLS